MKPDKIDTRSSSPIAGGPAQLSEREVALSQEVRDILRRYPDIGEAEAMAVVSFLKDGSSLAVGLMGSDDEIGDRLRDFRRDHTKHFRPSLLSIAVFVLAALGPIALMVWVAS